MNNQQSNIQSNNNHNNSSALYVLVGIIVLLITVIFYLVVTMNELRKETRKECSPCNYDYESSKNENSNNEKDNETIEEDIEDDTSDNTVVNEYDTSMFRSINLEEFTKYFSLNDNNTYFVYTGRENCSYCVAFLPSLQQSIKEYDYELNYLDMNTVTPTDISTVQNMNSKLSNFGSTPIVYIIKNGQVIDSQVGYTTYGNYEIFLKDNSVNKKI